jgi:hypothetical protein
VGFDIHEMADRTGIGASFALVTRRNIGPCLPFDSVKKIIASVSDEIFYFVGFGMSEFFLILKSRIHCITFSKIRFHVWSVNMGYGLSYNRLIWNA